MATKRSILTWLNKMSAARLLLLFYFLAIILSTILLSLPVAYKPEVDIAFIDILFTAVSALSVTGLSTITIIDTLRSEEHTSELQSRGHLVCRLLLEKK